MFQLLRRYKIYFLLGILFIILQTVLYFKLPINISSNSIKSMKSRNSNSHKDTKLKIQSAAFPNIVTGDDEDIINSNSHVVKEQHRNEPKSNKKYLQGLNFIPKCDVSTNRETVSAVHRAKSQECKQHIIDIACDIASGKFYPKELPNYCPSKNYIANRSLGCFKDDKKFRILSGYYNNFKESNSPKKCIQMCLQSGFLYAGVQYS